MAPDLFQCLLKQAQNGCEVSANQLLDNLRPYLLRLANDRREELQPLACNPSDLAQLTMLGAYAKIAQFRGGDFLTFRSWLTQILKTNLQSLQRRFAAQKRQHRPVSLEHVPNDSMSYDDSSSNCSERSLYLLRALSRLSKEKRDVIKLAYSSERLTTAEIAQRLGKSSSAVESLKARAIRQLREELADVH